MILNKAKTVFMYLSKAQLRIRRERDKKKQLVLDEIKKDIFLVDQIIASFRAVDMGLYQKYLVRIENLKKIIKKLET